MSADGKVKPNAILVGDVQVAYPIGHYALRSKNGTALKYTWIGGGAT